MSQQYRAPTRNKNVQDCPALKLLAVRESGMERNPSFMFYVHENVNAPSKTEVRAVVWTQCPENDPKKQKLEAKMDITSGVQILVTIERVARDPRPVVEAIAYETKRPKDYKNRSLGMISDMKIVVGKNDKGVYISLLHWNSEMPRRRFFFGSTEMFDFVINEEKGQTFTQFSEDRAIAHAFLLKEFWVDAFKKFYKPWTPDENKGNNNYQGGGNSNYQGGGNNYQSNGNYNKPAPAPLDDDLDDIFG